MEFFQGSFRGSVDERRVAGIFMTVPSTGAILELRFEFTDPNFALYDLHGNPTNLEELKGVQPYTEPRQERNITEGR
jgi:hypothetical protein